MINIINLDSWTDLFCQILKSGHKNLSIRRPVYQFWLSAENRSKNLASVSRKPLKTAPDCQYKNKKNLWNIKVTSGSKNCFKFLSQTVKLCSWHRKRKHFCTMIKTQYSCNTDISVKFVHRAQKVLPATSTHSFSLWTFFRLLTDFFRLLFFLTFFDFFARAFHLGFLFSSFSTFFCAFAIA